MLNRRALLTSIAGTGIGTALFQRSVVGAMVASNEVSVESIQQAEWITGIQLTEDERSEILKNVKRAGDAMEKLRNVELSYEIPMAVQFAPTASTNQESKVDRETKTQRSLVIELPETDEGIAFLPVHQLAWLIRTQKISSVELTNIYLRRLKKYGGMLRSVVTLTEELALRQAAKADSEISKGWYRGPLHGIPWGAKDLIAVEGYPTTWGLPQFKDRELEGTATVAARLEEAGAVLVAKLSLGAIAMGDKWFGGMTRSPWDPRIGSSGSSAGSASSVVAGLVGFALGSETLGSIISPSVRCGATALRPTFGRVSRDRCMPLCWSLDKIGPIARSMEDCALIFNAIHGSDGRDNTAGSYPFQWPSKRSLKNLRVGYAKRRNTPESERKALVILKSMGCNLVELSLPKSLPFSAMFSIIDVEASTVFDSMIRENDMEGFNLWKQSFRAAQFISAVDYVRVQRARSLLIKQFNKAIADVDFIINMNDLVQTNFTGHPSVVMPIDYHDRNSVRTPTPVILSGHLNDDERLLAFADAFQVNVSAHQEHPNLDSWLDLFNAKKLDESENSVVE